MCYIVELLESISGSRSFTMFFTVWRTMKKSITLLLLTAFLFLGAEAVFTATAHAKKATASTVSAKKTVGSKKKKARKAKKAKARKSKKSSGVTREQSISVLRKYLPDYADLHETKNAEVTRLYVSVPATFDYRSPFASSELRAELISTIDQWLGVRYRYGGNSHRGVDCSGFTSAVVSNTLDPDFRGNSRWQAQQLMPVFNTDSLQFGDLVFFAGRAKKSKRIGHVGIYIGNGVFAHSSTGRGVIYSHITDGYYTTRYRWGGRFLSHDAVYSSQHRYSVQ